MRAAFRPRPLDTSAEADLVQMRLLRDAGLSRRLALGWSLSAAAIGAARAALRRTRPWASKDDIDLLFVEAHYGPTLAADVREDLARRRRGHPRTP